MSRHHADRGHVVLACLLVAVFLAGRFTAGAAGKTVWDGVYGAAQAERGQALYAEQCSTCHGDFLDGDGAGGRIVALSGTVFTDNWESASLNDLFAKIAQTMPRGAQGTLRSAEVADLVAFLLQFNGFPAGTATLAETPELALVDIVGKEGPRPLRVGAGVRAVGCLTAGASDTWTLSRASALVRTRNPLASSGADVERARAMPLGSGTIRLTNAKLDAPQKAGTKVEVKGALSTVGADQGITVMSLQVVGPSCE